MFTLVMTVGSAVVLFMAYLAQIVGFSRRSRGAHLRAPSQGFFEQVDRYVVGLAERHPTHM